LKADIQVDGNSIEFTSITIHDSPLDGVDTKVDVYLANEYGKGTAPLTSVVLRNEKIQTNERSDETIEISSGIQSGQTELIPGEYVAIFTSRNVGDAVHANNTKLHPIGFSTPLDQPLIPAFTRVQKRFFSVQ
jgi:hypothetical protein